MDRQQLVRDMKQTIGSSFITKTKLATYIGVDRHQINKFVDGLDRVSDKYYFIPDVAKRILEVTQ